MRRTRSSLVKQKEQIFFNTVLVLVSFAIIGFVNSYKQNKIFDPTLCITADFLFTQITSIVTTVATRQIERIKAKKWWNTICFVCIGAFLVVYGLAIDSTKSVITYYIYFCTGAYIVLYGVENYMICRHFKRLDENGAHPNDLGRYD